MNTKNNLANRVHDWRIDLPWRGRLVVMTPKPPNRGPKLLTAKFVIYVLIYYEL
jgi:hypothetical protein